MPLFAFQARMLQRCAASDAATQWFYLCTKTASRLLDLLCYCEYPTPAIANV